MVVNATINQCEHVLWVIGQSAQRIRTVIGSMQAILDNGGAIECTTQEGLKTRTLEETYTFYKLTAEKTEKTHNNIMAGDYSASYFLNSNTLSIAVDSTSQAMRTLMGRENVFGLAAATVHHESLHADFSLRHKEKCTIAFMELRALPLNLPTKGNVLMAEGVKLFNDFEQSLTLGVQRIARFEKLWIASKSGKTLSNSEKKELKQYINAAQKVQLKSMMDFELPKAEVHRLGWKEKIKISMPEQFISWTVTDILPPLKGLIWCMVM